MPPQLFNPLKTPAIRVSLKRWKKVYWLLKYTVYDHKDVRNHTV